MKVMTTHLKRTQGPIRKVINPQEKASNTLVSTGKR